MAAIVFRNVKGTAFFEMLIFTPLALLFLFATVDAGLTLTEKAALRDAVQTGVNSSLSAKVKGSAQSLLSAGALSVNPAAVENLLNIVSQSINANLAQSNVSSGDVVSTHYKVSVSAVMLSFHPDDGRLIDYSFYPYSVDRPPGFNIRQSVPDFPYVSREDFLEKELASETQLTPSRYAVPLGLRYELGSNSEPAISYLPQSFVVHAEITALPRSIGGSFVGSILGKFYGLQEQQLFSLGTQGS